MSWLRGVMMKPILKPMVSKMNFKPFIQEAERRAKTSGPITSASSNFQGATERRALGRKGALSVAFTRLEPPSAGTL